MKLTLNRPLVFFDLETTGTDVHKDRVMQISYSNYYLHLKGTKPHLYPPCEICSGQALC